MSRHAAAADAAVNGLVGLALCSVGSIAASALVAYFDPVYAAFPAILVWGAFVYFGLKQIAYGLYTVVEDAANGGSNSAAAVGRPTDSHAGSVDD